MIPTSINRSVFLALCIGVLTLLAVEMLPAQNVGKVSGVVKDAQTGEPLIGCNVTLTGTTLGASTDVEGSFFILNIPPGKYDVQASILGYQKVTTRDAVVDAGRTTKVDFKLAPTELQQKEVVVEATRPDVELEKTSTSAIIRSDEVQTLPGIRTVSDVLTLAADVTDGHFRGGRTGEEYYTLQGMGIVNPLDNTTAFMPIMSAVEEVEVITSGFGAQYGNAQSGVVNISMKEGKQDKWTTRIDTRMRVPGRKHFGPSIFDPAANPYLTALLDGGVWLQGDPNSPTGAPYYWSMGSGLNSRYANDTAVQVAVARALWQMQTKRDLYRNYGNKPDYSVETSAGGPVDDHVRMFLAVRSNNEWPAFPTEQPDVEQQVMGNLAADLGGSGTLRLSGGYSQKNSTVFPSVNGLGYQSWLWDRILSVNYQKMTNLQLGARLTYAVSPSTFYEVKLSSIITKTRLGSTPSPGAIPDSLITDPQLTIAWNNLLALGLTGPDQLSYLKGDNTFNDELTRTILFDGSVTSQVTRSHLLNAGAQLNLYRLEVSNSLETTVSDGGSVEHYNVSPVEGALYVQDKMEFEGLIANVGLRWDVWSSQSNYYTNIFTPYTVLDSLGNPSNNPLLAPQEKAPVLGRLQPRAGISFPVSVLTVFHINYGSFMQRPSFQYVVSSRVKQGLLSPRILGNPRLLPETTNSYDLGVTQGLGEGFTLDVSGYYKDVQNLVEQATFTSDRTGATYTTYFNRDYADIRGFRIALTKRRGAFTGSLNYQYGVATGKSATTSNAPPAFELDTSGHVLTKLDDVPIRDILLDFDRTHNLIINLAYATGEEWGPVLFGCHPFEHTTLASNSFIRSGRPFTDPLNSKLINGARAPSESNTNIRLTRDFPNFFGISASFYFEVFNLFDNKILNYDYVFAVATANKTNKLAEAYVLDERAGRDPTSTILYWPLTSDPVPAWGIDQSFLIYSNTPRAFNLGFTMQF